MIDDSHNMATLKAKQAEQYDRHAKDMTELKQQQTVRIQPIEKYQKEWKQGTVSRQLSKRSYEVVTTDGQTYRRNRIHLKPTEETDIGRNKPDETRHKTNTPKQSLTFTKADTTSTKPSDEKKQRQTQDKDKQNRSRETAKMAEEQPTMRKTRSGRSVKTPKYLEDFVCCK